MEVTWLRWFSSSPGLTALGLFVVHSVVLPRESDSISAGMSPSLAEVCSQLGDLGAGCLRDILGRVLSAFSRTRPSRCYIPRLWDFPVTDPERGLWWHPSPSHTVTSLFSSQTVILTRR